MKKLYAPPIVLFLTAFFLHVNSQTPYAIYPLDGNALDISGHNRNGAISGSPVATFNRYSQPNKALVFNGTTDYIDLPSAFDFPSRTVMVWFNASHIGSANGYNYAYTSDGPHLQNGLTNIHPYTDGTVGRILRMSCDQFSYDSAPIDTNQWYHAAITRSPTAVKFYINGVLVDTQGVPNGLKSSSSTTSTAVIGADRGYLAKFFGEIDDVRIYDYAANDTAIYNAYISMRDSITEITGKVFFDANQNQVFDSTEQPVRNQLVNVGSNYLAITNNNGDYAAYPAPGTYIIRPALSGNIATFPFSPDSIIVAADSLDVVYTNNNFGVDAPANYCEANMAIVALWPPARPGFDNPVNVRYVNAISASAVSQTLEFHYPPQQAYVSATPAPTTLDTLNHTLSWNITNLGSGTLWQAMVHLHTPQAVALGSILQMTAIVTNSTCTMLDSPFQTDEDIIVLGSFDPNDKAVSPIGQDPGGRIHSDSKLSYTIRFQNTGTFMAENVNVIDTISPFLNLSTLKVEAASHNYEVLVNGREVTFRFSHINLADSNTNEPLSHGYIKYSISPNASFVQNSVVQNTADIYFDYNAPVRTNTTVNTADNSVGIEKTEANNFGFSIYPNPVSGGNWHLVTDVEMIGKEFKIFDAAGRLMYSSRIVSRQSEIDASRFAQGVYLLKIESSAARIVKL
jgi:hypothetical protein